MKFSRRYFIKTLYGAGAAAFFPGKSHAGTAPDELFVSSIFTPPGGFTSGVEGPACDIDGNVYAVNYNHQGTIGKVTPDGIAEVFVELPEGSTGNGIRFDSRGDMLIADYTGHNILKVDMVTRAITVHAHEPSMNQPNDLAITADDIIFASDPDWKAGTGRVWRIDSDGTAVVLDSFTGTANGIEVAYGDSVLYVNTSNTATVWAYDLGAGGSISNRRLLVDFPDYGTDGMRCDIGGNLYVTRTSKGTVAKVSPDGEVIREIAMTGRIASNIAFGGPDGRTCYVTMADKGNIETFRVDSPGRSWQLCRNRMTFAESGETGGPYPFSVVGNYPNPFNAATAIEYRVAEGTKIELSVYNMLGQRITTLARGFHPPGRYTARWNAGAVSSGVYFVRLSGGNRAVKHAMTVVK